VFRTRIAGGGTVPARTGHELRGSLMRVLHVVTLVDDQVSYGGAVTVALNQCIELRRRGHDARIAAGWRGTGAPPTQLEGVPAHLFRARALAPGMGFSALFSSALVRWVRDHATSFDVAHLHLARDLVPLSVAAVLHRAEVPYVVQAHGALRPAHGRRARLLDRRTIRHTLLSARHIFALTPEERDTVARIAGTTEGISLLGNGIVLPERVPVTTRGGPADVVFLGRLQPTRRVMAFAAAAERLVADGVEATFSVVGPDGGDLRALRRFIAERPALAGRLRYEGALPHDQAVERLRRADLYVLPSVEDQAAPMSLLEAMAAGVASICTTECGLAGTLAREGAAHVANPTDDAIYGAMRRLLVDASARARISAAAAATAASMFSMAAVAEVLEEEYGAQGPVDPPRQRLLWVTDGADVAHVEAWEALRTGVDLTVALLDDRRAALTERRATPAMTLQAQLTGRGYAVIRVPVRGDGASLALRDLVRERPDVVVLDGDRPRTHQAVERWARRAGVSVVKATPEAGPGAAAAAAVSAGSLPPRSVPPVDLGPHPPLKIALPPKDAPHPGVVWPAAPGSPVGPDDNRSAWAAGFDSVIDLHRHSRSPWSPHNHY
jgi:glycosyltransferase involved in cell wall biosynthesis